MPLVGLYDSLGARIQEGLDVTRAIGRMFYENSISSGVIPQLSAMMGPCIGAAATRLLTDFIFIVKGTGQLFITGPPVIKAVTGEDVTTEQLGGWKIHSEVSGVADVVCDNDQDCLTRIQKLLTFLPPNCRELPAVISALDPPDRMLDDVESIVPEDSKRLYDIKKGDSVARRSRRGFSKIKERYAKNIVIGFARIGGHSAGFVANQPKFMGGTLDVDCSDKASRFIRFCDAFNVPIITLVDVPGYLPGTLQEQRGIIRHGAKMLYAYSEATVPKLTVCLRKGYGGAKQAMCTREMGADQVLVWPGVELAVMGAAGAVDVLFKREIEQAADPQKTRAEKIEEFSERFSGPFEAVSKMYSQGAVIPRETRCGCSRRWRCFAISGKNGRGKSTGSCRFELSRAG